MFEAVLLVCAGGDGAACREALVPGFAADSIAACEQRLAEAPEGTRCVAAGDALEIHEVAPGVYVHMGAIAEPDGENRGDVSNMGFVIGESGVAVIDTGAAAWVGEALWRSLRAETDLPVTHVILTHMHPDHIFGTRVFEAVGAEIVGHASLNRAIQDRAENYLTSLERLVTPEAFAGTTVPVVTVPVEARMEIDLGNRVLRLDAWPYAHSVADVTVLDTGSGTLFAGDLVFHRHLPALDGSLRGWQAVMADLADEAVAQIVPGHGGPVLAWPEGYADTTRYLGVLAAETKEAIESGARLGEAIHTIAQDEEPLWDLFEAYNPRNATVAFTELEWE